MVRCCCTQDSLTLVTRYDWAFKALMSAWSLRHGMLKWEIWMEIGDWKMAKWEGGEGEVGAREWEWKLERVKKDMG